MYQAKSVVKKFSLYQGGGGWGQCPEKFFGLNMYQAKSGVKKISLYRKVTSNQANKQTYGHYSD